MEQLEEKQPFDVIVIGAGAAGMMAAGTAARSGRRVLLIEKMEKSGRKVRITGKGRCNVTNARPAEEFADQVRTNAEFFKVAFSEFNNRAAIKFFERAGVKLDIERGDRVFPQSGKAWDIANALLEFCVENGVKIIYNTRVTEILTLGDRVFGVKYINRRGFERKEECAQVILATGGVSYRIDGRRLCLRRRPGSYDRAAASVADAALVVARPDEIPRQGAAAQRARDALCR
jgi:predicted Rossmann fold flavoprotein